MPDQNKNSDGARFEKLTKSVLETDHPFFGKIKKELPMLQRQRAAANGPVERIMHALARPEIRRLALIVAAAFVLSFFIYRQITDPFLDYRLGETAQRHLIAPRTMEMVDEETTEAKRRAGQESVLSIYDYDRRIPGQTLGRIKRAFETARRQHQAVVNISQRKGMSQAELEKTDAFADAKKSFGEELGVDLTDSQFDALVRLRYDKRAERILSHLVADVNMNLIVSNRELLKAETGRGITLNRLADEKSSRSEITFQNVSAVIDVENARLQVEKKAQDLFSVPANKALAPYGERLTAVAKKLVGPNLTLNRQETDLRRKAVIEEVKPVIVKINKGDTVVRFQETINKRHLTILSQMERSSANDSSRFQFFFTAAFLTILLHSLLSFLKGGMSPFRPHWKDAGAVGFLMVATILGVKGIQVLATEALINIYPHVPFDFYVYLVPVSAGAVIVRMLLGKEPALVYAVLLSVVGGILLERNFFYAAYILSSSLLAASMATSINTRSVIYRAGILTGVLNVVMIACIIANTRNSASFSMLWEDMGWIFWAGMLSGLLMSMIVVSLVPVVELISGRTSDLRLLELANMNHPLLRDLMVKAPGTYHHCIVIGSLVEAAAEAIGANPLMARVMAYYHDVGKMERPLYFIENQGGGYNRHDGLQPHMSAMIIREHVKKGQELGRKFKLPQPIIDAMSEHHGSSTIWYFFNKARSQAEDPDSVLESDYKYDGAKPQTKETALVMLGDVVEAATRSVADPTPLRLSGVVKNILNKYFAEGQLSECDLTLRDLDLIAKSFMDVLLGIYHARIEYGVSSIKDGKRKPNGGTDSRQGPRGPAGSGMAAAAGGGPPPKPVPFPGARSGGPKKS